MTTGVVRPGSAAVAHDRTRSVRIWTLALTSLAAFMVSLDALVVVTALPSIQRDLRADLSTLEWTVNAYTLAFAAGIVTAAALGDRFGRRRVFAGGLALFSVASAACALAPTPEALIAARAVQGLGAAVVTPLALTILASAFPAERRGMVLGLWGGITGLAVAGGPLVGGGVTQDSTGTGSSGSTCPSECWRRCWRSRGCRRVAGRRRVSTPSGRCW